MIHSLEMAFRVPLLLLSISLVSSLGNVKVDFTFQRYLIRSKTFCLEPDFRYPLYAKTPTHAELSL
jgi:hypothetical protein